MGVTKKAYLGIDNIHVVRDSLSKMVEALRESDVAPELAMDAISGEDGGAGLGILDRQALRQSGWLKHLSSILQGTLIVVRTIHVSASHVLVHCSDGWDRTAQITALSQLCLDPYYRTIKGLIVLIEKEWVSFGHKFLDRCGHLSSERFFTGGSTSMDRDLGDEGGSGAGAFIAGFRDRISNPANLKEMSPVFHQFLECVRNIQRQFPERFEYNELFLTKIYWQLCACESGTFLFNSERERRVSLDGASSWSGIQKTHSVWEWFLSEENMKEDKWLNPSYDKSLDQIKGGAGDMGVLLPSAKDVRFWNELYGRTDEDMNGKIVIPPPNPELKVVGDGVEDDVMAQSTRIDALSVNNSTAEGGPSSRNGTPQLSTSLTSSTGTSLLGRSLSRDTSPAILTSPSPKITAETTPSRPAAGRLDSFRPYSSTGSTFSMGTSPTPQTRSASAQPPTTPTSDPFSKNSAYSSLYERPPPPQSTARLNTNVSNQGSGQSALSAIPLSDSWTGFASNAGGGMKSIWDRFSSNASAALSVVQDATKDLRTTGSAPGGGPAFTAYGGATGSSDRTRTSALGWGEEGWNTTPTSASHTMASSTTWSGPPRSAGPTITKPKPRMGSLAIGDTENPWAIPPSAATTKSRTLEDEWKSATISSGGSSRDPLDVPLTAPVKQSSASLVAPTPRHANISQVSALTVPLPDSRHATPQNAQTEQKSSNDPLGVGLL
jgi:hypothetical protein